MNKLIIALGIGIILVMAIGIAGIRIHESRAIEEPEPVLSYHLPYDQENVQEVIDWLSHCQSVHRFYAQNPRFINGYTGNVSFQWECVANYEKAIQLIKEMR